MADKKEEKSKKEDVAEEKQQTEDLQKKEDELEKVKEKEEQEETKEKKEEEQKEEEEPQKEQDSSEENSDEDSDDDEEEPEEEKDYELADDEDDDEPEDKKETSKSTVSKIGWVFASLLLIALVASIFTHGFTNFDVMGAGATSPDSQSSGEIMSKQQVMDKSIEYLNENLMQPGVEAQAVQVTEEKGLYKIELEIQGRQFFSYANKQGTLLFPSAINLDEPLPAQNAGAGGAAQAEQTAPVVVDTE